MSILGLITILLFLAFMGGSVLLYYTDSTHVNIARACMLGLYILIFIQFAVAIFEWPAKVIDGILYISMGMETIGNVLLIVFAVAIAFVFLVILPRIKWKKFLRTTPVAMVICGVLLIGLLGYNEMFGGIYSFESHDDFYAIREQYEEYDRRFFPTKYIEVPADEDDEESFKTVAVYPFDVTEAAGNPETTFAYKVRIYEQDGALYYYPFTYKTYVRGTAIKFGTIIEQEPEDDNLVSFSDLSGSDLSGSDLSAGDIAQIDDEVPAE